LAFGSGFNSRRLHHKSKAIGRKQQAVGRRQEKLTGNNPQIAEIPQTKRQRGNSKHGTEQGEAVEFGCEVSAFRPSRSMMTNTFFGIFESVDCQMKSHEKHPRIFTFYFFLLKSRESPAISESQQTNYASKNKTQEKLTGKFLFVINTPSRRLRPSRPARGSANGTARFWERAKAERFAVAIDAFR
jgi:hypothetical protein